MGIFRSLQILRTATKDHLQFTEAQRLMYTAEKQENFRWVSKLVSGYSGHCLKEEDVVSEDLVFWLREIGQFAEVIYAAFSLDKLLDNYNSLCRPGFPMEGFYALSPDPYISAALPLPEDRHEGFYATSSGVRLLEHTKSTVANLPAAIFSRWVHNHDCVKLEPDAGVFGRPRLRDSDPDARQRGIPTCRCSRQRQQIIVSISGTSSIQQAIHDLRATRRPYPGAPDTPATVHTGFWELYKGMRASLIESITTGLQLEPDKCQPTIAETTGDFNSTDSVLRELIVTGHSMGGAIAHLLCMDLLSPYSDPDQSGNHLPPPGRKKIQESLLQQMGIHSLQIITFGEPRTGNQGLVDHWVALKKRHEDEYGIPVQEWSVKAYNDGVPALPLMAFGYRHFAQQPLYTVRGKTYRVPESEREYGLFHVESVRSDSDPPSGSSSQATPDLQPPPETHSLPQMSHKNLPFLTTSDSIPLSPLGGHNYYNERDMEGGFLRRMEWLAKSGFDRAGWRDRYEMIMQKHAVRVPTHRRGSLKS